MSRSEPLSIDEITAQLSEVLELEFTFLRIDAAAEALTGRAYEEQSYLLEWVERVASTNIQIAFLFLNQVTTLIAQMDREMIEAWALDAVDTYDRAGLRAAVEVIENADSFVERHHQQRVGAVLDRERGVLLHFIQGLSGRRLKLESCDAVAHTDSEVIYLPAVVAQLETPEENFQLLKGMAVLLWAQTRYGSFRQPLVEPLARFENPERACRTFATLERLRLESVIARELPGVSRQLESIKRGQGEAELPSAWHRFAERLMQPEASVESTLELLDAAYASELPTAVCYQGAVDPALIEAVVTARIEREKMLLRVRLAELTQELQQVSERGEGEEPPPFGLQAKSEVAGELPRMELTLNDQPVAPPEDVRGLLSSIMLDLGEIPDEYLVPAGPGEYDPKFYRQDQENPDAVWQGTYHEEGAFIYPEWDYRRQHYRKNWCAVREREVEPVEDEFVESTLERYHSLIKQLRKSFEAMRDEDRLLKRQTDGDDVDIDALVEALADAQDGRELSDRLFTRMHRSERNIAVMLMVDMSGSTRGWINDAERESLLLLCEALETLGDRYAIYGFSGMTRKRCELYRVKTFDEPYSEAVRARISGIRPQDYTRMGFAIRHLSKLLSEVEARTRILVTLSDGKPDDYNDYRGEYGIEDTRRALIEARRSGIHPYCITIDEQARDYLPHLYGPAAFTAVDDVRQLPLKVSDIYRRLTL